MAPSVALLESRSDSDGADSHAAKRRKTAVDEHVVSKVAAKAEPERDDPEAAADRVPKHPYGIKPLGNLYDAQEPNLKLHAGCFSLLPDELIITLLEHLQAQDLLVLQATCKALYAFARAEELWKALFIASPPPSFQWRGTWRTTHLSTPLQPPIDCAGLYSDVLYRPFHCAHIPLEPYTTNIPTANAIPRLPDLSAADFNAHWADQPFILTDPVRRWPVYHTWSDAHLLAHHAGTAFRAEAVDWPLATYMHYMRDAADESPLYLFDCYFAEKMHLHLPPTPTDRPASPTGTPYAYTPPACFTPDLFHALGPHRPHHRWLILGPARSGSSFHKDPNATSAWNAVLRGAKYWIMCPQAPPGVFVSPDQSEVTSPLSIAEWLLAFHAAARATPGTREGVCAAGELLHVPSGWFHLVLNVAESVALTHNFVPRAGLAGVLGFLRDRPEQVTGFAKAVADPYALLVERLREGDADALDAALREVDAARERRKTRWEEVTADAGGGFSFGFGGGDGEDEDEGAA